MTQITPALFTASLLALGLYSAPAQALTFRTFVSAHGSDLNPCTLAAPCKTFAAAHTQTSPGGIIDVLDPAGYGAVTITKSTTITGRDWASILVTSGNAITINANPGDVINLRGLIIDGAGTGNDGIQFNSGGTLNIQNSVIRRFGSNNGIAFKPSASSRLFVSSTLVSDNGSAGILVAPTGSGITVTASLNRVEADNNFYGVFADGTGATGAVNVTVADSVAANNIANGFNSFSDTGQAATAILLVRCVAVNNGLGVLAEGPGATLTFAQSTVTGNDQGLSNFFDGALFSYGDNNIDGNTNDGGTPPVLAKK